MNATEAKVIATKANEKDGDITALLPIVYGKIRQAAGAGRFSIVNPLEGLRIAPPSEAQEKTIMNILSSEGYEISFPMGFSHKLKYARIAWNN